MATLRDIKKRIATVKSTQKITKAMKMVAAAKLRRAQMAVIGSRPYATKLRDTVLDIVSKTEGVVNEPLFCVRENVKNAVVLVYTSNRGLCGGFNSNLLRRTERFLRELTAKGVAYEIVAIGKRARDYLTVRKYTISENYPKWADKLSFDEAVQLVEKNTERYLAGEIDEYYLIYNQFKSAMSQEVTIEKLLPVALTVAENTQGVDAIYEPSKAELLKMLLPKFLATQIYKAHLESNASELGARMTAMDSATKNATEMIGSLTLKYNRVRQAAITTELMDIVNGAESLN